MENSAEAFDGIAHPIHIESENFVLLRFIVERAAGWRHFWWGSRCRCNLKKLLALLSTEQEDINLALHKGLTFGWRVPGFFRFSEWNIGMAIYEWGKSSPALQGRRVSAAEKKFSEEKAAVEAAYREAMAELDIRWVDIAESRAQLDRYYRSVSTKKGQPFGAEEQQRQLPTRLDFISKSIRAEMAAGGAVWSGFEDGVADEVAAAIAELSPDEAVDVVLARAELATMFWLSPARLSSPILSFVKRRWRRRRSRAATLSFAL